MAVVDALFAAGGDGDGWFHAGSGSQCRSVFCVRGSLGLNREPNRPEPRTVLLSLPMRIAIGADHAGFSLKEHLKETLTTLGHRSTTTARTATRRWTIRRSARRSDARWLRERPIAESSSAAADRASRLPPTKCAACGRRCATIFIRRACRASTTMPTSSRWAGASSPSGSRTKFSSCGWTRRSKAAGTRNASIKSRRLKSS